MVNPHLRNLLAREMTRKEFLVLGGIAIGSIFGVVGLIRELASHASTLGISGEAEGGARSGAVMVINDSAASGGSAVTFGAKITGSDLDQPVWKSTVVMSNLSTASSDNLAALNMYISAAAPNTKLIFPTKGTFKFASNIDIRNAGIGLFGSTSNPGDTILLSTHTQSATAPYQTNRGLRVFANNVFMKGFTHSCQRQASEVRSTQDQQGDATLLLENNVAGFKGEDLLLDKAAASGFFSYGATDYRLNRVVSQFSYADSFHNTNGSSYYTFTDCTANQTGLNAITQGDDSFANVHYSGDTQPSHHGTFIRCKSYGSSARAASVVSCHDITYQDFYAEDSWRPGVYVANEQDAADCSTYNVLFTGTTILKNCCKGTSGNGIGNGAFFSFDAGSKSGHVYGFSASKVAFINIPNAAESAVRGLNYGGMVTATFDNFAFYGTIPNGNGYNNVYNTGSSAIPTISLTNWNGLAAKPNNNWTATVLPESQAPSPVSNGF